MSNPWEEDENSEFLDRPEETMLDSNGQMMRAPAAQVQSPTANSYRPPNIPEEPRMQPIQSEVHPATEDQEDSQEEDFSEVLNDANLRIEQGRLYQMVMNHELFEGMDVDPKAIQNVQKEIRKFARERMEVMLGMRKETSTVERLEIDFPFNELEVEVLKQLAFTATKGATKNSDNYVPQIKRVTEEIDNVPKKQSLTPISKAAAQKKLPAKPQAPIKRGKLDKTVEQILAEEGVPRELIEEDYVPIGKPLDKLTPQEFAERKRQTAQRLAQRKTVRSNSALPMASPEQQEMLALQRATQVSQGPGMAAILDAVRKMPVKNPQ